MTVPGNPFTAALSATLLLLAPFVTAQAAPKLTTLYTFPAASYAYNPSFGVVLDSTGALDGITQFGSACVWGTVFRLVPPKPGATSWTESTIADIGCSLKEETVAGIGVGSDDTIYGATLGGVFAITHAPDYSTWTTSRISSMAYALTEPYIGTDGTLYFGTGGSVFPPSAAFSVTPLAPGGTWTTQTIWNFTDVAGGFDQEGAVTSDAAVPSMVPPLSEAPIRTGPFSNLRRPRNQEEPGHTRFCRISGARRQAAAMTTS